MLRQLEIKSRTRTEFINITSELQEMVGTSGIRNGLCHLFVLHTTAAVTINEGADPAVQRDITTFLNKLVPSDFYFTHAEGNSDAHIKASLIGPSESILIDGGKLVLGMWQAAYLCEFDGPRSRQIAVKLTADS
ncbi:MAG TPA: secondary thiamine-phosphate synthase enzyme YjbQ [Geobacteraceae bacterium]|nr:secondary thiamine-phosphate synthase enzyme YjbQ [Geobacteraceae bacterium]